MTRRLRRLLVFVMVLVVGLSVIAMPVSASHSFSDGFEDEPADSGVPEDWEITQDVGTNTVNVTTARANTGSQSMGVSTASSGGLATRPALQPYATGQTSNISYSFFMENGDNSMFMKTSGNSIQLGVNYVGSTTELQTHFGTTLTTGLSNDEWVDVTIFNIDFGTNTYSVTWDSPSDSGTQTGLTMNAGDVQEAGYNITEYQVSNSGVSFLDDFSVEDDHNGIEGYVTNPDGDPLEDVTVQVFNSSDPGIIPQKSTTTDATGNWSVSGDSLETGDWTLVYQNQSYYEEINETTYVEGELIDVGRQNLTPIPTAYFNATPRGGEYVRNRSTNAFNISIETREPDGQDSQVTSRFMWYNETTGAWEEFKSISWNTNGGTKVTHDFESPHDWNAGSNRWFVNTTTDRGNFHSSNYTWISPGNITLVNASDTSQVITTDTFDVTLTSLDSNFEDTRQTSDGKLDLNDIPREDYRVDIVQAGGAGDWRDRILIIDDSDIAALWTVALVNNTVFQAEAPWYSQEFELVDETGEWNPRNVYLLLEQRVGGDFEIVAGDLFGFQNSVTLDVNDTEDYRMTILHAVRGDIRTMGTFTADRADADNVTTITVTGTVGEPTDDDTEGYTIDAYIDGNRDPAVVPFFRFTYNDPEDITTNLEFTVYEKGNEDNILRKLSNVSFDQLGKTTFTQTINNTEANMTWVVDWSGTRNGTSISGKIIVGGDQLDPGVDMPDSWMHWGATIFIILIGGLFGGSVNARLGVIVTPMIAGVFFVTGFLPQSYTLGIVIFSLILGGMVLVANHQLGD